MGEWDEMFIQSLVSLIHSGLEKLEYSVFLIKFHKNKKCYSDNVDMKFGALNKLDKRNMTMLNNLRMTSLEQIEKSLPLFWIRKPGSRYMVHTSIIFINDNLLSNKKWKHLESKNLERSTHIIALSKRKNFAKKCWHFEEKMLISAKSKGSWLYKVYF